MFGEENGERICFGAKAPQEVNPKILFWHSNGPFIVGKTR